MLRAPSGLGKTGALERGRNRISMAEAANILVIGGGLVGLAAAWRVQQRRPGARIVVLEKENRVGAHQSGRNSGVLHAGLYYRPGSYKARLAVRGIRQMIAFCRDEGIPHEVCGKIVAAATEEEVPRLRALFERGMANGLRGLEWLEAERIAEFEPHARGAAAIRVPEEGIVDYIAVCERLAEKVRAGGGQVQLRARTRSLRREKGEWIAETTAGAFRGRFLINCAGLHADRVARMAGARPRLRIVPFRGEYRRLKPSRRGLVRNLIYPTPDPRFPFLGVHFTRLIHGGVEAGPNAVLAFAREGYNFWTIHLRDLAEALSFPGLWRFLAKYPAMARRELAQSLSERRFCRALQRLVPEIRPEDLEPGGAGVRAQAMLPDGRLAEDFHIERQPGALHVLNAPSPAATASLAIGEHLAGLVEEG